MKIVILGSAHPLRGGLAAYNERLAREFQQAKDEVNIETFSLQYPEFLFPGTTQYSSLPAPEELKIHVSVNSINPFNWIKIGWKLRKQQPDILVVKFWLPFMAPCLGTICRIAKSNKHTKIISILALLLMVIVGYSVFFNNSLKKNTANTEIESSQIAKSLEPIGKTNAKLDIVILADYECF